MSSQARLGTGYVRTFLLVLDNIYGKGSHGQASGGGRRGRVGGWAPVPPAPAPPRQRRATGALTLVAFFVCVILFFIFHSGAVRTCHKIRPCRWVVDTSYLLPTVLQNSHHTTQQARRTSAGRMDGVMKGKKEARERALVGARFLALLTDGAPGDSKGWPAS